MTEGFISKIATDALSAFLGGGALAVVLFLVGEKIFPMPRMNGRWFFQVYIHDSAREPFRGMYLKYEAVLWQEGPIIRGTTEKIYESSKEGRRRFNGTDRIRGNIDGYLDKFYFARDRVRLHLVESGSRTSTTYIDLKLDDLFHFGRPGSPQGFVESMVGSSSGITVWSKNRYSADFDEDVRNEHSDRYGDIVQIAAEAAEPQD